MKFWKFRINHVSGADLLARFLLLAVSGRTSFSSDSVAYAASDSARNLSWSSKGSSSIDEVTGNQAEIMIGFGGKKS
jgi:hypothetical protein